MKKKKGSKDEGQKLP